MSSGRKRGPNASGTPGWMRASPTMTCCGRTGTVLGGSVPKRSGHHHGALADGKASRTDGPYAETKAPLSGILVREATDLHHAIPLMLKHPGVKAGAFETRLLRTCPP